MTSVFSALRRAWVIVPLLVVAPGVGSAQQGQTGLGLPPASAGEEAAVVAQIWAMVAEGRAKEVVGRARQLLNQYPRSAAVLATAIEVDIAANGATSALTTYQSWLGGRATEEPLVVRRMARAILYEWGRQTTYAGVRNEALITLAQDGDAQARTVIEQMASAGQEPGLRAAVRLQYPGAIFQVITQLRATPGEGKLRHIELLAESRSMDALPTLVELLKDPNAPNRASAVEAIGRIGGGQVEPVLLPLLKDENGIVRTAAAAALYRNGIVAGASILEGLAVHENPRHRLTAAQLLSSRPDDRWLGLVRSLLADPSAEIRMDSARLIEPHDPAAARAAFDQLSADPNMAIREEVELARAQMSSATLAELRALMAAGQPLARVRAGSQVLLKTR